MNEINIYWWLTKTPGSQLLSAPRGTQVEHQSLRKNFSKKNRKNLIRISRLLFSVKNSKIDQAMCSTKIWPASSSMSARLTQFSHAFLRETFLEKRQIKTNTFWQVSIRSQDISHYNLKRAHQSKTPSENCPFKSWKFPKKVWLLPSLEDGQVKTQTLF